MIQKNVVAITSVLTMLLVTFHHSDDVVRGMATPGLQNLIPIVVLLIWLYGTVVLGERRSGHVINLVASLLATSLPLAHILGSGLAGKGIGAPDGAFFFVWTLIALAVAAGFSAMLSIRALRNLRLAKASSQE